MRGIISWIKAHFYSLGLLYFVFYLAGFFLLEEFTQPKYIIHSVLDDYIPFNEYFFIPYVMWFPLLAGSLLYFMLKSKEDFINLCFLMFSGMTFCLIIYALFPNGLELRVVPPRDNLLSRFVLMLHKVDTPTNVCPSIHVSSTVAINMVVQRSVLLRKRKLIRIGSWVLTVAICASTVFLKQHSVIDIFWGVVLSAALYPVTFFLDWRGFVRKRRDFITRTLKRK